MFAAAIPSIIALLAQIAPTLATTGTVKVVVDAVVALAPIVVKLAPSLIQTFKGVITTIRGKSIITTEQYEALDAAEAVIDADWDRALEKALAEDAAADKK